MDEWKAGVAALTASFERVSRTLFTPRTDAPPVLSPSYVVDERVELNNAYEAAFYHVELLMRCFSSSFASSPEEQKALDDAFAKTIAGFRDWLTYGNLKNLEGDVTQYLGFFGVRFNSDEWKQILALDISSPRVFGFDVVRLAISEVRPFAFQRKNLNFGERGIDGRIVNVQVPDMDEACKKKLVDFVALLQAASKTIAATALNEVNKAATASAPAAQLSALRSALVSAERDAWFFCNVGVGNQKALSALLIELERFYGSRPSVEYLKSWRNAYQRS